MTVLKNYCKIAYPPKQFASEEALNFSDYLKALDLKVPNLAKILGFEECTLLTLLDNEKRMVSFDHDPFPLLRSLSEGTLSTMNRQPCRYEIKIIGDMENAEFAQQLSVNNTVNH